MARDPFRKNMGPGGEHPRGTHWIDDLALELLRDQIPGHLGHGEGEPVPAEMPGQTRAPNPLTPLTSAMVVTKIAEQTLRLVEPARSVLVLRFRDGLSRAATAEQLGLSPDSVQSELSRGLALLRVRLDGETGSREAWVDLLGQYCAGVERRQGSNPDNDEGDSRRGMGSGQVLAVLLALATLLVIGATWRPLPFAEYRFWERSQSSLEGPPEDVHRRAPAPAATAEAPPVTPLALVHLSLSPDLGPARLRALDTAGMPLPITTHDPALPLPCTRSSDHAVLSLELSRVDTECWLAVPVQAASLELLVAGEDRRVAWLQLEEGQRFELSF